MAGDWIHERYVVLADSIRKGKCLKTDCWNEAEDYNPIKADVYLEINKKRCEKARAKGYNVLEGDVTSMPFKDGEFDCIFDCSTIDHVGKYEVAINEYKRCLKSDGKVLIVVWLTDATTHYSENDGWGSYQYWFNVSEFRQKLIIPFKIEEEGIIHSEGKRHLGYYICSVR